MQQIDVSRPRIANHVFGLLLRGAIAGVLIYGLLGGIAAKAPLWQLLPVAVPALLFAAGALRSAHSLLIQPHLILESGGIQLRYWCVTDRWWDLLIPWRRVVDLMLPWPLLTGLRTHSVTSRGVTTAALNLETPDGMLVIGGDVFAMPVDQLLSAIAGYREVPQQLPLRTLSGFEEFQKARFAEPVRMVATIDESRPFLNGCLAAVVFAFASYFVAGAFYQGYPTLGTILAICVVLLIAWGMTPKRGSLNMARIMECREEGLALGWIDGKLRLFPWSDVLSSRIIESSLQYEGSSPISSLTLELNLKDVGPIRMAAFPNQTDEQIQNLIMPPLERVIAVRQLMSEQGMDMRAAAEAVGLLFAAAVQQPAAGPAKG